MADVEKKEKPVFTPEQEARTRARLAQFKTAFQKAMAAEAAEDALLPKVFEPGEGLVEVIDDDDKIMLP